MDKSWMSKDRLSQEYVRGVENFLTFATSQLCNSNVFRCPCLKCGNLNNHTIREIRDHLFFNGIDQSYRKWIWHGESLYPTNSSNIDQSHQFERSDNDDVVGNTIDMVHAAEKQSSSNPKQFKKLLEDAEKPLYPGCTKFTKLSALVKLYNLKAKYGFSVKSFSELLSMISNMLPDGNELPLSLYEAKKTLNALGVEYEKIHTCPKDCILYRKQYQDAIECPKCKLPRWKVCKNSSQIQNRVPAKVLWYFSPIPRFKRMFQSEEIAKALTWHANEREIDGMMRHPSDSPSWKLVDHTWPEFASDPRNLRLALAADGINPHRSLNSRHSCWPVMMVTYNLPPWLCMKRKFIMLTLLISGPKQPGNDIDVYLEPLIDDLKTLWEDGIETYDAYQKETFKLRCVLLWTINDFPAYGNLSGQSVKGYYACPICSENTYSCWLNHGKKVAFMGHRRFLPQCHPYRKQKKSFNGQQEFDPAPEPMTGEEILSKVNRLSFCMGKGRKRKKSGSPDLTSMIGWKKKSIFFELAYWKSLHVRHILDVMHIEKNVCDSIIGTLLNIPSKTKDGLAARLDLKEMGLRDDLVPKVGNKRTYLPPAYYTLSKDEKQRFCKTLFDIKAPEGYFSNFRNIVSMQESKLLGLKSHDCHILMQQLLPLAIRSVLPQQVRHAITRFCFFFNALCKKVIDITKLEEIQSDLVVTLCMFEKYFPPFFDIMIHLTVHLIREVRLCRPVYYRWMYPFERFMKVLKGYVRNRNHPEGCIAESYIAEEAVEFCTGYLSDVDGIGIPSCRNYGIKNIGKPLPGGWVEKIDRKQWEQAHHSVLENTLEVQPYINEHMEQFKLENPSKARRQKWLQDEHNRTFIYWLRERIGNDLKHTNYGISDNLRWIAYGPRFEVMKYSGYDINDRRYWTKNRDMSKIHNNSGVMLVAKAMQIASSRDKNPVISDMSFYGVIQEIWDLDYNKFRIPVFLCDWVDSNGGVKVDNLEDQSDCRWSVVQTVSTRDHGYDDDVFYDIAMEHDSFSNSMPDVSIDFIGEDELTYLFVFLCRIMDFPNGNNDQEDVSRLSLHPPIRKRQGRRQNISNVDGHEDDASQLKPSKKSTIVQTDSTNADDQENAEQSQLHSPSKKHKGRDPPEDYNFIELSDWQQFVKYRVSEEFLKLRNDQKDRQSHNKYPHRLSRSGYVGLEEELKEDYGTTEDFDRHVLWMAARENANGDYEGEKLLSFVDKIEEIRKEVHAGKISVDGNKDILTMAFGKPEHCGRLAVGSKSNLVALGTIMPTDGPDAMVHGIPLNGNVRVTIDVAIKGSALLPIPGSSKKVSMNKKSKKLVAQPEVSSLLKQSCPRQLPGSLECGYYIMKYMRDVIFDTYKSIPMKMAERKKYDQADIDFVRNEWVRSVDELL
ncbi:hypothetical protein EZV62_007615 [Acer yangbiense]|uniref:Transposase-associated domain-containing protein n=1 Tax=Acer yangbiense TaxID=1000413 RepID=A0A5C7IAI0_9ROSI|nr:hypothetical protein EZV62_007615 [Acer yangbiense]